MALASKGVHGSGPAADRSVIFLMLVGGPSQVDTFDPKPDAPSEIRGPFRSIETAVPGVRLCEHLPETARRMGRVAIVRSMHHDAAPIHETGQQLLQTGHLCRNDDEFPHFGSVVASLRGHSGGLPSFAILPGLIGNTGVAIPHGQSAGPLAPSTAASIVAPRGPSSSYGSTPFGDACHEARRLVEAGTRVVVVNMYQTVFNGPSWDCHGTRGFATLDDQAREVLPTFDRAYSALLDDLDRRGLLDSTLVVASGEFGRTPRLNAEGGRDHWTGVWSALLAGGGIPGGQVIGRSDRHGSMPADQPVTPQELLSTIYQSLGLSPRDHVDADPIGELNSSIYR